MMLDSATAVSPARIDAEGVKKQPSFLCQLQKLKASAPASGVDGNWLQKTSLHESLAKRVTFPGAETEAAVPLAGI